jgi:predicted AlkP superfamily pyrophosphatase or phosphodiesterase
VTIVYAGPATPLLPAYGVRSLGELLPSIAAAMEPEGGQWRGPLAFAPVRRACVLLVDGLGSHLLAAHADIAPTLAAATVESSLTTAFPSTTATSLATLGTGLPPGRHGITGVTVRVPGTATVMNSLTWENGVDPRVWQPWPTVFEHLLREGVAVTRVGPAAFDGSGLTEATLRGGDYVAVDTAGQRAAAIVAGLARGERSLVYAYHRDLDLTGHVSGCDSLAWREELALIDAVVARLAALLPADAALWVTGDHGMVDVTADARIDLADEPELSAGIMHLAGEPRARHLHTRVGAAGDVLHAWRERLGDRAWVCSRAQAVAQGWFGAVEPRVTERIGDVVVAARDGLSVVDRRVDPPALLALIGHHGSLTPAEVEVPLLQWRAG